MFLLSIICINLSYFLIIYQSFFRILFNIGYFIVLQSTTVEICLAEPQMNAPTLLLCLAEPQMNMSGHLHIKIIPYRHRSTGSIYKYCRYASFSADKRVKWYAVRSTHQRVIPPNKVRSRDLRINIFIF